MVHLVGVTTDSEISRELIGRISEVTLWAKIDPTGFILVAEIDDEDDERYYLWLLNMIFSIAKVRCDLLSEFIKLAPDMTWTEWEECHENYGVPCELLTEFIELAPDMTWTEWDACHKIRDVYREHDQTCYLDRALWLARKYANVIPTLLSAIEAKYGRQ